MELYLISVFSVLLFSGIQSQKPAEKLTNIANTLEQLREELLGYVSVQTLDEIDTVSQSTNADTHDKLDEHRDYEILQNQMNNTTNQFMNTILMAFRDEKMRRLDNEKRTRRDLGSLQDKLQSLVVNNEKLTEFTTEAVNVLRQLKAGQENLLAYVKKSVTETHMLRDEYKECDKIRGICLKTEAVENDIKRLDAEIRNMTLNIMDVLRPVNLAVHKQSFQSSNHYKYSSADKANDGSINSDMLAQSCTHTNYDRNAWWMVDLGGIFHIGRVIIYNRGDCCGDRLKDFIVSISETKDGASEVFATWYGSSTDGEIISLTTPIV